MKDDPDKAERAHPVERTIVEMAMSAMVTAVEAGNGVPEAKALARAAVTILASVVVGGVLTRVEADDLLGRQIKRRRAAMERFPAEDLKLVPTTH